MLVDSHCHLDFPELAAERDAVVARARAAGVGCMVTICTQVNAFAGVLEVAEAYPDVYCTVGLHPHDAANEPETTAERLVALAAHPKVVGIGESGLDYYYQHSPREVQQEKFRAHIAAARQTGLPLVVHTRDADGDMAALLEEEMAQGAFGGVLHCFSSSRELAERALALGFYISLSGILTFRKADELRDIARALPLDRLLVETDAPFLAPVPHRGKRNEPAFVARTADALAELRGLEPAEVARATTANFRALFRRAAVPAAA